MSYPAKVTAGKALASSFIAGAAVLAWFERLKEAARGKVAQHDVLNSFAAGRFCVTASHRPRSGAIAPVSTDKSSASALK